MCRTFLRIKIGCCSQVRGRSRGCGQLHSSHSRKHVPRLYGDNEAYLFGQAWANAWGLLYHFGFRWYSPIWGLNNNVGLFHIKVETKYSVRLTEKIGSRLAFPLRCYLWLCREFLHSKTTTPTSSFAILSIWRERGESVPYFNLGMQHWGHKKEAPHCH